jgi:O-antigen ligase
MRKAMWHNLGEKLEVGLLWLSLILAPWQLRHTVMFAWLGGGYFEYGSWQIYASEVAILMLLITGVVVAGRQVVRPLPQKINLSIGTALIWMTVSATWASDRQLALVTVAHWWLLYLWCTYLVNRVKRVEQIIWPLMVGAVIQAGIGVAQYVVNHSIGLNYLGESILNPTQPGASVVELDGFRKLRAYGLMPHPNLLGGWLVMTLAAVGLIVKAIRSQWQWWLLGAMVALTSIGMVLSFSRIAWAAGLLIIVALLSLGWWLKEKKWLWLAGLILLVGLMTLGSQYKYVANRFDLSANLERQSVEERELGFDNWRQVVSLRPNVGVGLGSYAPVLTQLVPGKGAWWYAPVHNIYLLWTAELGSLGVAIWVWVIASIGIWMWQRRRRSLAILASLSLVTWLVLGMTDHWPVSLEQGQILFFLALALIILGSRRIIGTEQEE